MAAIAAYFPQLLVGLLLTLEVSIGSMLAGLLIGVVAAPLALFGRAPVRRLVAIYVTIIRGLPELLIIFLVFYGGTVLLTRLVGHYVEVDALTAGIVALSVVAGAYLTEIIRGALEAIPRGQWEACRTLGLRPVSAFVHVILPQMLANALPALGNQWLVLLKESALVSVVGLEELMRKSVVAAGSTHQPLQFYAIAALLYIMVTGVSTLLLQRAEDRLLLHRR